LSITNENFVGRRYGVDVATENGMRKAIWTIRRAKGPQDLYYKTTVLQ